MTLLSFYLLILHFNHSKKDATFSLHYSCNHPNLSITFYNYFIEFQDEGDLSSPEQQPSQERLREACRGYSLLCAERGRNFGAPISNTYREKLAEPGIVYSAGGIDQRGEDDGKYSPYTRNACHTKYKPGLS